MHLYRRYFKRAVDFAVAASLLVLLSPLLVVVAVLVWWKLGWPILYRQRRPGLHGRPFVLRKFRTMTNECDELGQLLPDGRRLTAFGQFLRYTSLDELPELWNVLRGQMSLVGPRPLLMSYLGRYSPTQARRHEVRPGITGWAQVHGRNVVDWERRLELDVWYVDHYGLWIDLKILCKTLWQVAGRRGVAAPGHATMPEFTGKASVELARARLSTSGVVVLGAGGHAKVVVSTLQAAGERVVGIFDDAQQLWGKKILGVPVLGPVDELAQYGGMRAVIGIGDNRARRQLAERFQKQLRWLSVVHPQAWVHPTCKIGDGTVVMAGAVLQPDCLVGDHCIVNTGATVDHDCRLGDYVHLAPGAHLAGSVRILSEVLCGVGSSFIPGVTVGQQTIVGAGSVVTQDIPPHVVAVGVPARPLKPRLQYKAA